jgi:hypothetical protein
MLGLLGFLVLAAVWGTVYSLLFWLHRRGTLRREWHPDALAIGILILVVLAFYWPLFFTQSWIPKGGGDLVSFIYPIYAFAGRWLKRGIVPLWNPHLYLGMPFAADNQSGLFYPINLLFFLLTPELSYEAVELMAVLHVFLAGMFAYVFLRDTLSFRVVNTNNPPNPPKPTIERIPAVAGAIAYMLSDLFVVHPGNLNIIATAAWLPLALYCFRRAIGGRRLGWTGASGVVLGIAALVGHVQMFLYVSMSVALYAFFEVYLHRREGWGATLGRLGKLLLTGAIAFGLSALSLVPAYDLTHYTVRSSMSYVDASEFAIPPAGLVSVLMPGFFGRGTGPYWGPWPRTEMGYVGIFPLVLALIALVLSWRHHRLTRFMLLLGAVGLLIALGPNAAFHGWTYALIPFFRQLRVPARAIFVFDFAIAVLGAGGLDLLLHPLSRSARRMLGALNRGMLWIGGGLALVGLPLLGHAVVVSRMSVPSDVLAQQAVSMGSLVFLVLLLGAAVGGLALRRNGLMRPRMLGAAAIFVIAFDLVSLGAYVEIEPNDPLGGYRHDRALAFLKSDAEIYRVETTNEIHGNWAPDWALLYEMDDLNGIWNPLRLGAYDVLTWVGIDRDDPFYKLYNVKYLITGRDTPVPAHFEAAFDDGAQMIYRNTETLPRAFMVYDVVFADGDIDALGKARLPDFDPATQIVLKWESGALPLDGELGEYEYSVETLGRGPNHIDLGINTSAEGYLFVSEMWMPGWVAYVDGARQPVLQANYTFRAVHVPAGSHEIHMVYRPRPWLIGLGMSTATIAVLLVWGGWSLLRARRGPSHLS